MRFRTSALTAACFCAWLEAAPARVAAQTSSVVAPQQADGCHEVNKRGKGKPDPASYTYVFDTVQASPTPPPSVDACKIEGFWSWLRCNSTAVSAVASSSGAIFALGIGIIAFFLNRNIRKGQIVHEQMRMLLEIDGELVDRPELWAVHGKEYTPAVSIDDLVKAFLAASPADKPTAAMTIADALSKHPNAAELRQLAFATRYFNFFELLFTNYRQKHWWSRDPEKNEEWQAWRAYIEDFFTGNEYARNEWWKFAAKHIYSASFEKFMLKIAPPPPK